MEGEVVLPPSEGDNAEAEIVPDSVEIVQESAKVHALKKISVQEKEGKHNLPIKGEKEEVERKLSESIKDIEELRWKVQASLTFHEGLQLS